MSSFHSLHNQLRSDSPPQQQQQQQQHSDSHNRPSFSAPHSPATYAGAAASSASSEPDDMFAAHAYGGAASSGSASRSYSPVVSSTPVSQQQLVLRGSELVAFTGALKEMLRTNHVRASRQAQLNEANAQLHAMNFFLHYCNAERSVRAQKEYESVRASIEEGRLMLTQMSSVIASQEEAMTTLGSNMAAMDARATEQAERVTGIEGELVAQKAALTQAMAEYEARLAAQERDFRAQEAVLARLLSVRFKIDFGLDVLMGLLAWYAAHNGLVSVVAGYIGHNILFRNAPGRRTRNRYTRNWVTGVQLLLFMVLLRRIRRAALDNGIHHAIGSYTKYLQWLARMCGTTINFVRGGGMAAVTLDQEQQHRLEQEGSAGAHAEAASSADASVLAAEGSEAIDGAEVAVGAPLSPDFFSSGAASLGRTVGSALLTGLQSGRDSVRWILNKTVATSAPQVDDEEVDSQQRHAAANRRNSEAKVQAEEQGAAAPAAHPQSQQQQQLHESVYPAVHPHGEPHHEPHHNDSVPVSSFSPPRSSAPFFVPHDLAFASSLVGGVIPSSFVGREAQQHQPQAYPPFHASH